MIRAIAVLLLAAAVPMRAWSQSLVHRVPNAGELVLDFDSYRLGIADTLGWVRSNVRNTLRLPLAGALFHENLARYNLELRPALRWLRSGSESGSQSLRTRELGYDGRAQLFAVTRFPVGIQSTKLSGSTLGDFGEHQDYDERFSGAEASWRNSVLPITASVTRREFRDTWYPALQQLPLFRNERTSATRLSARNTKTSASLERSTFSDAVTGAQLRFSSEAISNLFRWGKGSFLTSNGSWNEVAGMSAYSRSNWTQRARIQHTTRAYSDLSYLLYSLGSERFSNRGHAASVSTFAAPAPSLLIGVRASQSVSNFVSGQARMVSVGPSIAYDRELWRGVTFAGTAAVYRDWHERQLRDQAAFIIDEPYVVDSSRRVLLRRLSIEIATVDVRSADRTSRFSLGVDYQLFATEVATELVVIPGGRIAVGDTLLLTYAFKLPARQPVNGISADYGSTITAGPFSVFYRWTRLGAQAPTAVDFLSASTDESSAGARLSWHAETRSLDLSAEERHHVTGGLAYLSREGRASVSARSRRGTLGVAALSVNRAEAGRLRTDATSLTGGASWWPMRALQLNVELRGWWWRPSERASEKLLGGSLGGQLHLGLTDVTIRFESYARQFDGLHGREDRIVTRLLRRY